MNLIGTDKVPPGLEVARGLARKSRAYYDLRPYPKWGFKDWKTEERGPLPRCLPFVRRVVNKGARWLFRGPVTFSAGDDKALSETINNVWQDSSLASRAVGIARRAMRSGSVDLFWGYDEDSRKITVRDYDPTEETRLYFDPLCPETLLMARVQVAFWDYSAGGWMWHREDWTDDTHVVYKPYSDKGMSIAGDRYNPYSNVDLADKGQFEIKSSGVNPFGVIPCWRVKNVDVGGEWGEGDFWPYFETIDLINFTRDLEHKHNQKFVDPQKAMIDLEQPDSESPDASGAQHDDIVLQSVDGKNGDIRLLEANGSTREHVRSYAEDLLKEFHDAVGSVRFDPEDFTNKGNLTGAVFAQMYQNLIEATEEKRTSYGEDGLSVFFERMCKGMANAGVDGWNEAEDIQTHWPSIVPALESDKREANERTVLLFKNGLISRERAIRDIAESDGVVDVDEYIADAMSENNETTDSGPAPGEKESAEEPINGRNKERADKEGG